MAITVQRKPVPLQAWHLADAAAMLAALDDLATVGWRGGLTNVGAVWRIELNADDPTRQVVAETGDWLIDDFGLRALSAEDYDDNYEVAE